ncbi:D-glucuronyl C5-epimerase family protein [Clostridium kluyveri]|uniref:D-glucuronyl C5-epimerase C-terminal domain-containing protein n=1 Tax=Clostridium kluyveri TaxID=1534 RepID=A0A1L5F650_CLOKL|nr:D-glucuronyl C5-epimerase family protein [Clostridium kluyveri]APM38474.1 hypothetical protein BS101_06840 [Clostridium kluyveri]
MFKKISYIGSLLLIFFICTNTCVVQASQTADNYYDTINNISYSDPYTALDLLSKAHSIYPNDERFINGLNEKAELILNWSRGTNLKGNYADACQGYTTIINTQGVSEYIKDKANILNLIAKQKDISIKDVLNQPEDFNLIEQYQKYYMDSGYQYQSIGYYDTFDNYLSIENAVSYTDDTIIKFDVKGIPMVNYSGSYYYNPVTIDQYALSYYNIYLNSKKMNKENLYMKQEFLNAADWLIDNMDSTGAIRYDFNYKHYLDDNEFQPGWVSAMAQGQALSVFSRAYHLTGNKKYISAGNLALNFLTTKTSQGGPMDNLSFLGNQMADYIFFQLYVTDPPSYTLNGHMFTLIGLYDWSNIPNNKDYSDKASAYFKKGLLTLKYILPYYDIGGFVCYDLGYLTRPGTPPTVNFDYYGIHLTLLDALNIITGDNDFKYYRNLWTSYIQKY